MTLRGEHDLHSWSGVTVALANASQRPGVVVDLSECTFLDSTMLTALLVAAKQLRTRGGALAVVMARGTEVRRIFEVMNVDTLVEMHETRSAAIDRRARRRRRGCPRGAGRGGLSPGRRVRGRRVSGACG